MQFSAKCKIPVGSRRTLSCYRRKEKEYWHLPKAFGCATAADVHTTVYREGMWRRCLRCRDALPTRTCAVCNIAKELAQFNPDRLKHHTIRGDLLRCDACMTCSQCKSTKTMASNSAPRSRVCVSIVCRNAAQSASNQNLKTSSMQVRCNTP